MILTRAKDLDFKSEIYVFWFSHRCRARARTKQDGKHVEIVDTGHNHQLISQRRKKGHLKKMLEEKKSQRVKEWRTQSLI